MFLKTISGFFFFFLPLLTSAEKCFHENKEKMLFLKEKSQVNEMFQVIWALPDKVLARKLLFLLFIEFMLTFLEV